MDNLITNEISELHQFFEDYFLGKIDSNNITRFIDAIDNEFQLISPSGTIVNKDDIISMIRSSYGSRSRMRIWTENEISRKIGNDVFLSTYNELQELEDGSTTKRLSTSLFRIVNGKAIWLHVHETWIV